MVIYFIEYWYLIDRENKSKSCESFFNISNEITKFVTMKIDEEGLYKNIKLAISQQEGDFIPLKGTWVSGIFQSQALYISIKFGFFFVKYMFRI